ncbi:MAG: phytoene/squalene synthase family protein [bacterium]
MDWKYCEDILPKVSRTFALNIGKLEGDVYRAVLLGYLLFRIADTFEDTACQEEPEKIEALESFAEVFRHNRSLFERLKIYKLLKNMWEEDSPEKDLIRNADKVLGCYFELPEQYRIAMDPLLVETSQGMAEFQRQKLKSAEAVFQLADIQDLEKYCYYVAGVVGKMLTAIFCQSKSLRHLKIDLEKHQVKFGLALQVTNILKDYPKDVQRGWCYIPASVTKKYDIKIESMGNLSLEQKKSVLQELVPSIIGYFDEALDYIRLLPISENSIRLFCIIPFVLAYNTLFSIANAKGEKIPREDVFKILGTADHYAKDNSLLAEDYFRIRSVISKVYN